MTTHDDDCFGTVDAIMTVVTLASLATTIALYHYSVAIVISASTLQCVDIYTRHITLPEISKIQLKNEHPYILATIEIINK